MKKKLLALSAVLVLMYASFSIGYVLNQAQAQDAVKATATQVVESKPDVYRLWQLTNQARAKAGLSQLRLSPKLNVSASNKCKDMVAKDYWDHKDPSGTQPWHFITESGYQYSTAGENLAYGFKDTDGLFSGWMLSSEHKKNILDGSYRDVGFGVCHSDFYVGDGSQYIVVQHFAAPL